jgi:hypothetical protein
VAPVKGRHTEALFVPDSQVTLIVNETPINLR